MEYYVSEVIRAHEDERRYISSELHDSVIQSLSTLSISVGDFLASEKRIAKSEMAKKLVQFNDSIGTIIDELRLFCRKLRPDVLDVLGLESDVVEDCLYRIVGAASRSKPIRAWFKLCFPLWF